MIRKPINKLYRHYNITGEEMKVKFNSSFDNVLYKDIWLPVKIIAEYPKFLLVEVLSHFNPNGGYDFSIPYRRCINKMAIEFGEVEIKY